MEGGQFEEFCRLALRKHGRYHFYRDFSDLEKFNLPVEDKGVDLIRWDSANNTLHLVQCKFRTDTITKIYYGKDKLSHLEAMGYRVPKNYNVRLIIMATTECCGVSDTVVTYTGLMLSFRVWQRYNYPELNAPLRIVKRDYQERIVEKCIAFIRKPGEVHGLIIMPTGSGKTVTFLELLVTSKARKVIIVPTLVLLAQTSENIWTMYGQSSFNISSDGVTDPEAVARIKHKWILTTYNSLHLLAHLSKKLTLIVMDEAHNANAGHLETIANLPYPHKTLYFTATPTKLLGSVPQIAEYSLESAIADKYLVNYNVGLILDGLYDATLDPVSIIASGIVYCINHRGNRKIILYCSTVAAVETYATVLRARFSGYVGTITGTDDANARHTTLTEFKRSNVGILVNVRILREGLDIPEIDTVVFSVEKHSTVDIIQCIGRALRRFAGKECATVLVSYAASKSDAKFAKVLKRISPDITTERLFTIRSNPGVNPDNFTVDPERIRIEWLLDDRDWMDKYNVLLKYIAEYNELPLYDTEYNGVKLGKWASTQRQFYKKKKLIQSRVDKLGAISLWNWGVDPDEIFANNYKILVDYVATYKKLPGLEAEHQGVKIGIWVGGIRTRIYKTGRLGQEWIEKFKAIPGWHFGRDERTKAKIALVREYMEEHGISPAQKITFKGVRIGEWVNTQRQLYKKGTLSKEIELGLAAIPGWYWFKDYDADFNNNVDLLMEYVREYDHIPSRDCVYKGHNIGSWINVVRRNYYDDKLSKEKIAACESIKYWFWDYTDGLKSFPFWIREYRKPNARNSGKFREYNKDNYTKLNMMQKTLLDIKNVPDPGNALAIVEKTNLDFATKADLVQNKAFFRVFCCYQGCLFDEEFTTYLSKLFSDKPMLAWI